jgi:hypothetical protein
MQRLLEKENVWGQLRGGFMRSYYVGNVDGNMRILPVTLIVDNFQNYTEIP